MDASEIIQKRHEIYDRYNIPPWLREHMLRVAAVAEFICDHWEGPRINRDDIVAEAILHDIGNMAKFDFSNPKQAEIVGEEDIDYWKKVHKEFLEEYGHDEHQATHQMAEEVGAGERLLYLLDDAEFVKVERVVESSDFEAKICVYSDLRVDPYGIVSMDERFEESKERYNEDSVHGTNLSKEHLIRFCYYLENEIFKHITVNPDDINGESVKPYLEKLSQ